jgi:hypothetical protein
MRTDMADGVGTDGGVREFAEGFWSASVRSDWGLCCLEAAVYANGQRITALAAKTSEMIYCDSSTMLGRLTN